MEALTALWLLFSVLLITQVSSNLDIDYPIPTSRIFHSHLCDWQKYTIITSRMGNSFLQFHFSFAYNNVLVGGRHKNEVNCGF